LPVSASDCNPYGCSDKNTCSLSNDKPTHTPVIEEGPPN
jgi:hypothetical protein